VQGSVHDGMHIYAGGVSSELGTGVQTSYCNQPGTSYSGYPQTVYSDQAGICHSGHPVSGGPEPFDFVRG
jgi:hypothetical protein